MVRCYQKHISQPSYQLLSPRRPIFSGDLEVGFSLILDNRINLDQQQITNDFIYRPPGTPLQGASTVYDAINTRFVIAKEISDANGLPVTPVVGNTVFVNGASFTAFGVTFNRDTFYRYDGTIWSTTI